MRCLNAFSPIPLFLFSIVALVIFHCDICASGAGILLSDESGEKGSTVIYTISVDRAPNDGGALGFDVRYDSDILRYRKYSSGNSGEADPTPVVRVFLLTMALLALIYYVFIGITVFIIGSIFWELIKRGGKRLLMGDVTNIPKKINLYCQRTRTLASIYISRSQCHRIRCINLM